MIPLLEILFVRKNVKTLRFNILIKNKVFVHDEKKDNTTLTQLRKEAGEDPDPVFAHDLASVLIMSSRAWYGGTSVVEEGCVAMLLDPPGHAHDN